MNQKHTHLRSLAFICAVLLSAGAAGRSAAQTPAFPGAEGAGKYVAGGRGTVAVPTTVFEVTRLSDQNVAGTLRYACTQSATYRTIVFRVSGTIHLLSPLSIPGNTTLAGQTAPGDGVCLADYWVTIGGDNVIVRYLRFRLGDKNQLILDPASTDPDCHPIFPPFTPTCKPFGDVSGGYDSLGATGRNYLMVDHCSVSWCNDEALSLRECDYTTIQWTIISEPLDYSYHYEGNESDYQEHGYGSIFGGYNTTFHHNIYAHCKSRCPRFIDTPSGSPKARTDMRNNVIYNWRINTVYGGSGGEFNLVGNYYKAGPDTTRDLRIVGTESTALYYLRGNKMVGHDGENGAQSLAVTANNWLGTSSGAGSEATLSLPGPILTNVALTTLHTAQEAYDIVLATAGASIPKRDAVDARIVNEIETKTGSIIDVQGGYAHGTPYDVSSNAWPVLLSTAPPTDSDHDGMADDWETAHSLNPTSAADRNNRNAEGYTMLEVYLNSLTLPPPPPADLAATPGEAFVELIWSSSPTATSYNLKRSTTSGGPYTNLTPTATTNYTDRQVALGTVYFYVVSAVSAAGESTNSTPVSATPLAPTHPPAAPLGLAAMAGDTSVTLTWSPSYSATNYYVKRSPASGGPYTNLVAVTSTTHVDTEVSNCATYFYVVSAANTNGEGTNSAQVSATPRPVPTHVVTTVFDDRLSSGSSVNSAAPAPPDSAATSYQLVSSKPWNPSPSLSPGHLRFGIGNTSSGLIEMQALFTQAPVVLADVGDTLILVVTFTNTSGLLARSGHLGFGLYNSGQSQPVPGGMNSTVTPTQSGHATGNAQTWAGYVGQVAFTSTNSRIMTRSPQSGSGNNNQELVTSGSSSSYRNPSATTVGVASTVPSVTLVSGSPYTDTLSVTLVASNTLAITNRLYAGSSTNSILLSEFGSVASNETFLTNAFDALAVGWRARDNTFATSMDINQIAVLLSFATSVSTLPPILTGVLTNEQFELFWPRDHLGWRLQTQTNFLGPGNWVEVPGANLTNRVLQPLNTTGDSMFFRLTYP